MMEMANGIAADSNGLNPGLTATQGMANLENSSSPAQASGSDHNSNNVEKAYSKNEVTEIVKKAKQDALDTFRRMQAEQPEYLDRKLNGNTQSQDQNQNNNRSGLSESDYRRIAAEEAQRFSDRYAQEAQKKSDAERAESIVRSFIEKVTPAKSKYQDFDTVTADLMLQRFPNCVGLLATHVDNTGDILYELAKDRAKLVDLERDCREGFSDVAIQKLKKLSQSIKDNEIAVKVRVPNAPLSQLRATNAGADTASMSVSDYRAKFKKMK